MIMYYKIDDAGRITSQSTNEISGYLKLNSPDIPYPKWDGKTWVEDGEAKLQDIKDQAIQNLITTDAGMSRVVEDLVALLISKNVLKSDDIPKMIQDKIDARNELRSKL